MFVNCPRFISLQVNVTPVLIFLRWKWTLVVPLHVKFVTLLYIKLGDDVGFWNGALPLTNWNTEARKIYVTFMRNLSHENVVDQNRTNNTYYDGTIWPFCIIIAVLAVESNENKLYILLAWFWIPKDNLNVVSNMVVLRLSLRLLRCRTMKCLSETVSSDFVIKRTVHTR